VSFAVEEEENAGGTRKKRRGRNGIRKE